MRLKLSSATAFVLVMGVAGAALGIGGCKSYSSNLNQVLSTVGHMQLAVGTLNDSAGTFAEIYQSKNATPPPNVLPTYLNAVATFRNQYGGTAFPEPGNATITGPAAINVAAGQISSYGPFPASALVVGQPPAYSPADTNGIGYPSGIVFTDVAPVAGAYTISTTVIANGAAHNYSANANLPASFTVLGNEATPTYVSDGAGGGTFTVGTPLGIMESVVEVFNSVAGSCSPLVGAQAAAAETTIADPTHAILPAGTLVAGSKYCAFVLGADYPFVEAGPPANTQVTPVITGGGGTADLTASGFLTFTE